jgi:ribosomal small subunit protein bTHX
MSGNPAYGYIMPREAKPVSPGHREKGMGKGDKKTTRGKIWRGSYGISRPHHPGKGKPRFAAGIVKKKKK